MKRNVVLEVLVITLLGAGAAWAQQSATPAQAASSVPDLATSMRALEETLRSTGRVSWSQNTYRLELKYDPPRNDPVIERKTFWNETTNVAADSKSCLLRVSQQTSEGPQSLSYYFDEIFYVGVLSSEDFLHRYRHKGDPSAYQESVQPPLYSDAVSAWGYMGDFKFPTKESADRFAALLIESVKQCNTAPMRSAATGSPSLAETLNFIADKLTTQGRVDANWADTVPDYTGPPIRSSLSVNYFRLTPNVATCSLSFDSMEGYPPTSGARLSLRRIGKIELLKLKDYLASFDRTVAIKDATKNASQHLTKLQIVEASPTFVLNITSPAVDAKQLYFSDGTLADRVANAMVHAAELCGAGANREPF
jgi:hypothetical protein